MPLKETTAKDLQDRGLRLTRQRKVILEALRKTKAHPDAYALYHEVRDVLPRISLATVYRTLKVLAGMGLVREVESSGAFARFDGRVDPHHHITCTGCGRISDVELSEIGNLPVRPSAAHGPFTVTGYRIELLGLCGPCADRRPRARKRSPKGEAGRRSPKKPSPSG